jgi:hypothetical protein
VDWWTGGLVDLAGGRAGAEEAGGGGDKSRFPERQRPLLGCGAGQGL